jgi:uncharacterized repeat protein (TIGR02543 family)
MILVCASCFIVGYFLYLAVLAKRNITSSRWSLSVAKVALPVLMMAVSSASASAATQTVTSLADSGVGSLRAAIAAATAGDTVAFAPSVTGTIVLQSGLVLTENLTIQGPGATLLTLSGSNSATVSSILTVDGTVTATITGLTIANGNASNGAGILNYGTLAVTNVALTGNSAATGFGGAMINYGTLTVTGSTFFNNTAEYGSAISNDGTLTVTSSTFSGNIATTGYAAIINYSAVKIGNSTFSGNTAGGGFPAIVSYGTSLVVTNTLFGDATAECYASAGCPTSGALGDVILTDSSTITPLGYYGGPTQTMVPLPGSAAICAGTASLAVGVTTDQRGFPSTNTTYTGYNASAPCMDSGSVQTHYTSVAFVTQPTDVAINTILTPAPTVAVLETDSNVGAPGNTNTLAGIPISLTFAGTGTLSGTTTVTSAGGTQQASGLIAGSVASFGNLSISGYGSGDTFSTNLTITPAGAAGVTTLTATSNPFTVTPAVSVSAGTTPAGFAFTVDGTAFTATDTTTWGQGSQHILSTTSPQVSGGVEYVFSGWSDGTTTLTDTVTVPTTAVGETYAASFVAAYPLTLSASMGGSVAATSGGNTFTSGGYLAAGTQVQLTAVAANGYQFSGWTVSGAANLSSSSNATTTLTMGAGSATVTAAFAPVYSIWVLNGNATVSGVTNSGTAVTSTGVAAGNVGNVAIDGAGNIWTLNSNGYLSEVSFTGTSLGNVSGAGITSPKALAIDGQGEIWVANGDNTISVVSKSAAPVGHYTVPVNAVSAATLDSSGNLWLTSTGDGSLTEVIGVAAPVTTPTTTAVKNNTLAAQP